MSTTVVPDAATPPRVPGTRSPAMAAKLAALTTQRDVLGGIETLRAGGDKYLPKLSGETADDYAFRLALANFFNTPRRTVKAVAGLVCQQAPTVGEDGDPTGEIQAHWEAIDDRGNHGREFVRRFTEEATAVGFAAILVDMPRIPPGTQISKADAERLNLRPYWVPVRYEQIYDADWAMVGAQRVLVYLELHETVQRTRPGEQGRVSVDRYRVYTRAVVRDAATDIVTDLGDPTLQVWETEPGGGVPRRVGDPIVLQANGGKPLKVIPFHPCVAGDLEDDADVWIVRSPIQDLIDLSLTWYQVYAERRGLMNRACTQTLWLAGYAPTSDPENPGQYLPLELGASKAILVGEQGRVGYAAPSADGFAPTREELQDLERRMGVVGIVRLFFDGQVGKTVTGERNEAAPNLGILAGLAGAVQDTVEGAMESHAEYLGVTPPSVQVTTEFERVLADSTMIDVLTKLAASPATTIETVFAMLDMWRALPNGFDVRALVDRIKALVPDGPPAPVPGAAADTSVFGKMAAAIAQASSAPTVPASAVAP